MAMMEASGRWHQAEAAETVSTRPRASRRRLYLEYWNGISIALIAVRLGMGFYGYRFPFEVATLVLLFFLIGHIWLRMALSPPKG